MDAVKIPQNVNVDDKIIGPITLKQLFMLLGGGGVSYALYSSFKAAGQVGPATTFASLLPVIVIAAFAFIKINSISLFRFCILMGERMQKPSRRLWQPRAGIELDPTDLINSKTGEKKRESAKTHQTKAFEDLSSTLDTDFFPVDAPKKNIDTITEVEQKPDVVRDISPPQNNGKEG